jgi:hypothetical protein
MSPLFAIGLIGGFLLADATRWVLRWWQTRQYPLTADPILLQVATVDARHAIASLEGQAPVVTTPRRRDWRDHLATGIGILVVAIVVALVSIPLIRDLIAGVSLHASNGIWVFVLLLLVGTRSAISLRRRGHLRRTLLSAVSGANALSWVVSRYHLLLVQDGRTIARLNRDEVRDLFAAKPS